MNKNLTSIIGLAVLVISWGMGHEAQADNYCFTAELKNTYQQTYCEIGNHVNVDGDSLKADEEVLQIVADQYDIEPELVTAILDDEICKKISEEMSVEAVGKLPEALRKACSVEEGSENDQFFSQSFLFDVRESFEKEKALFFNQKSLKMKFQASEKFWDGQVGGPLDARFDLMVDLNLIEIVLFGSQADWMGDVYQFPAPPGEEEDEPIPLNDLIDIDLTPNQGQDVEEDGPVECVPPDDPDADPNANPGSPLCGNGSVNKDLGETCDDGNQTSGDGCNQFCEIELTGSSDICKDPDAITFKKPEDVGVDGVGDDNVCPPGTVPKKDDGLNVGNVAQNPAYPGPHVGGTLKEFGESQRPPCGPGESPIEITVLGEKKIALNDEGDPICMQTEFLCGDFDGARDLLFGEGWEDDSDLLGFATSIEAGFCVDVTKNNRPLAPYNLNEGCIDCHITAMADALEEALATNVAPLENTSAAFGLSSKFGPSFSFNMITLVKPRVELTETLTAEKAIDEANGSIEKILTDANKPLTSAENTQTGVQQLQNATTRNEEEQKAINEAIEHYHIGTKAIGDIEMLRVVDLITQMKNSFTAMQSTYDSMVEGTALNEKDFCRDLNI